MCGLKCKVTFHDIFNAENVYSLNTYGTPSDSLSWSPTEPRVAAWNSRGNSNCVTVVDTLTESANAIYLSEDSEESIGVRISIFRRFLI